MTHAGDAAFLFNTASAALYIMLGAWVLTLTPRRRQTTLLGVFALLFGLTWTLPNTVEALHLAGADRAQLVHLPLRLSSLGLALGLAWNVPDPLRIAA